MSACARPRKGWVSPSSLPDAVEMGNSSCWRRRPASLTRFLHETRVVLPWGIQEGVPIMKARSGSGQLRRCLQVIPAALLGLAAGTSTAWGDDDHHMRLESATCTNGGTLPLRMISTIANA